MNKELVAALDAEIDLYHQKISALSQARDLLTVGDAPAARGPKAERPAKKRGKGRKKKAAPATAAAEGAEPDDFGETINGVFVKMTEQEAQVFEALNAADDGVFVLGPAVRKATGLGAAAVRGAVVTLRNKLEKQAKSTIIALRGKGYRLAEV